MNLCCPHASPMRLDAHRKQFRVVSRLACRATARLVVTCVVASSLFLNVVSAQTQNGQTQNPAQAGQAAAAGGQADNPNAAPFPPLDPKSQAQLTVLLREWEKQSQGTKTLECQFQRWHYDLFAAPAGVHATKSTGVIKYASPDRGLFKVDKLLSFNGMGKDGKPIYTEKPGQFGEHWVCNGEELLEFDHSKKECRVQQLPPELRGQRIFESPLPFVFNLDAAQIVQRYWVRQVQAPKPGMILIEAYPKRQDDRAQYKLVQIALNEKTFLPEALLMYAPNFNIKTAPKWDHYEFVNVERNSIASGLFDRFMKNFIDEKPPADWKVFHNTYRQPGPPQMATPATTPNERR
ncbi:TIGR03009 domain-containing protein [Rhodopirellula sp. ICT_H3.1]|uniref:TIGR03009 domain-containing protein n=2 Tax=Aporhodopirellula aestuarii TaxID=2950107 RepID=A0ABT0TWS2_9BACT|nr:TIGR03009 domain-containing protein [Aporhodopirellula aestuarii]MCM2369064.1 TIGR03009 domain-containing protein [Aporhodopirellula aestuarii]